MLVRFGRVDGDAVVLHKGLVLDIGAEGDAVSLRCLGGNASLGTIDQTRELVKALTKAMVKAAK